MIQKTADLHLNPPRFVAAQTYERSVVYPNGHRNVMMPRRGIRPLPRGELPGTPEAGTPDTKLLYAYLKHFGGICASHTSATDMGTDWRDNDPEVEPVVEIYQGHRHNYEHFGAPRSPTEATQIGGYQPKGFVWNALEKGYRLGFESSSDHVSTHLSYAIALRRGHHAPGDHRGLQEAALLRRDRQHPARRPLGRPPDGRHLRHQGKAGASRSSSRGPPRWRRSTSSATTSTP